MHERQTDLRNSTHRSFRHSGWYLREISPIEEIDAQVKSSERKVSCGKGTQAIILNALGFVGRALYLMPNYLPVNDN